MDADQRGARSGGQRVGSRSPFRKPVQGSVGWAGMEGPGGLPPLPVVSRVEWQPLSPTQLLATGARGKSPTERASWWRAARKPGEGCPHVLKAGENRSLERERHPSPRLRAAPSLRKTEHWSGEGPGSAVQAQHGEGRRVSPAAAHHPPAW